jgi:hypothetical protein
MAWAIIQIDRRYDNKKSAYHNSSAKNSADPWMDIMNVALCARGAEKEPFESFFVLYFPHWAR